MLFSPLLTTMFQRHICKVYVLRALTVRSQEDTHKTLYSLNRHEYHTTSARGTGVVVRARHVM